MYHPPAVSMEYLCHNTGKRCVARENTCGGDGCIEKFNTYEEAIGRVRQLEDETDTRFVIVKKRRPGELIVVLVSQSIFSGCPYNLDSH